MKETYHLQRQVPSEFARTIASRNHSATHRTIQSHYLKTRPQSSLGELPKHFRRVTLPVNLGTEACMKQWKLQSSSKKRRSFA